MELNVRERLMIMNALNKGPGEDHIIVLRAIRELKAKVGFSAEELQEYNFQELPNGATRWKLDVPQENDIDLSKAEESMIADRLRRLEHEGKLVEDDIPIYERFVEGGA